MLVFAQGNEGSLVNEVSYTCPCVERVQGSDLLPVNVARQITLVGHNLHLYQVIQDTNVNLRHCFEIPNNVKLSLRVVVCAQDEDLSMDYECVLAIEGRSVVVAAFVKRDDSQPFAFYIMCQPHQVFCTVLTNTHS